MAAFDTNGTIAKYYWSVDGTQFDSTDNSTYAFYWSTPGTRTIYAKVRDNDGLVSGTNSVPVTVLWDTTVTLTDAGGWTSETKENSRIGYSSKHARDSIIFSTNAREVTLMYRYAPELASMVNVYNNGKLVDSLNNNFAAGPAGGYLKQFRIHLDSQQLSHTIAISHVDRFEFTLDYILYAP